MVLLLALLLSWPAGATPPVFGGRAVGFRTPLDLAIRDSTVSLYVQRDVAEGVALVECTGVLYAERRVLTAAHCVAGASRITVFTPEAMDCTLYGVLKGYRRSGGDVTGDLAVVALPAGASARRYRPVGRGAAPARGDTVHAAGYGTDSKVSGAGASAGLRTAALRVDRVDGLRFRVDQSGPDGVCSGDSGGPAFSEKDGVFALAGVLSATSWPRCDSFAEFESIRPLDLAKDFDYFSIVERRSVPFER